MDFLNFLEDQENGHWTTRSSEAAELLPLRETTNRESESASTNSNQVIMQVKRLHNVEALELHRTNKELQLQKRDLHMKLAAATAHIATLLTQKEMAKADVAPLVSARQELSRQVEALRSQRFSEVEELVYLRWVNACLRYELRNVSSTNASQAMQLSKVLSPTSLEKAKRLVLEYAGLELAGHPSIGNEDYDTASGSSGSECTSSLHGLELRDCGVTKKTCLIRRLCRAWSRQKTHSCSTHASPAVECGRDKNNSMAESFQVMSRSLHNQELTEKYPTFKDRHKLEDVSEEQANAARSSTIACSRSSPSPPPPPPPPLPPPPSLSFPPLVNKLTFYRAPQVIELYHAMMRQDLKKDAPTVVSAGSVRNSHSHLISEIENKSSHLLAIKADVEQRRELVMSLVAAVRAAVYPEMDDVLSFVTWLDQQLASLVDERAVLKHFDWPEAKTDALRESAFTYRDLKKLEGELTSLEDNYGMKRDEALNRMQALMERTEKSIYAFLRTSDKAAARYREFGIPTQWMLPDGLVRKVKRSSVKLAEKFMKRVLLEVDGLGSSSRSEPVEEFLLLQGVRFAFRVHQFAGGFDDNSMRAFEELRDRARNPTAA